MAKILLSPIPLLTLVKLTFKSSFSSHVLIIVGNGFNAANGHFVAPVAGNYEFSLYGRGDNNAYIEVRLNGQLVQYITQQNGPNNDEDDDDESHIFHMKLEKGDDVNLYLTGGTLLARSDIFITFIGKLISEVAWTIVNKNVILENQIYKIFVILIYFIIIIPWYM